MKKKYFVFSHLRENLFVPNKSLIIHGPCLAKEDKVFKYLNSKKRFVSPVNSGLSADELGRSFRYNKKSNSSNI